MSTPTTDSTGRRVALVALVVATLIATVWFVWPDPSKDQGPARVPLAVVPGSLLKPSDCHRPPTKPFVPKTVSVRHVATDAEVLALPRDANNVPEAPAISDVGKTQFAWDAPTVKPGSRRGNALFNAHTWPDGSALGNRLLEHLQVGGKIIVRGTHGIELCYRVTKRTVILAADGSAEYYVTDGPPQLALIVCSPPRLGPGNWQHRTIWYASPIKAGDPV